MTGEIEHRAAFKREVLFVAPSSSAEAGDRKDVSKMANRDL